MTDETAEILALEERRCAALVAADIATLDELFADQVVYTHSNASTDTRESYLESIRSGSLRYRSMARDDVQVLVYEGAAVIAARVTLEITAAGVERTVRARATITWVREGGRWQFAAWQSTPLPA